MGSSGHPGRDAEARRGTEVDGTVNHVPTGLDDALIATPLSLRAVDSIVVTSVQACVAEKKVVALWVKV